MRIIRWGAYLIAAAALAAGIRMYTRSEPPPADDGSAVPVLPTPRTVTILATPAAVESPRAETSVVSNVASPESAAGDQRMSALRDVVSSLEGEAIYVEGVDHGKKPTPRTRLPSPPTGSPPTGNTTDRQPR